MRFPTCSSVVGVFLFVFLGMRQAGNNVVELHTIRLTGTERAFSFVMAA